MQRCREGETLRFGSFELKTSTGELFKFGVRIRLPDQSSRILLVLLRRPGELVTREELQDLLWAKGTCVDFDHGLNLAINRLRRALSDPPQLPHYVETLPRKGYRFIGTVEVVASPTSTPPPWVEPAASAAVAGIMSTPVSASSGLQRRGRLLLALSAAGLAVLTVFLQIRQIPSSPAYLSPTPLISGAGQQMNASFAPDGERIVFSWKADHQGDFDIYVKQIGVETPLRLTTDPRPDVSPAWSPDGRTIAFVRFLPDNSAEVLLIPSLAKGPERLVAHVPPLYFPFRKSRLIAWSTDSKFLVVPRGGLNVAPLGLALYSIATGSTHDLTRPPTAFDDLDPIFSPDMKHLAFVRHAGFSVGDLYVVELTKDLHAAGAPKRLTFDNGSTGAPVWMRDSRSLLFIRYSMTGKPSIWKISLANSRRVEPLRISVENAAALAISPRNERLVYTRAVANSSIWRIELSSAHNGGPPALPPKQVLDLNYIVTTPSFSPDGRQIAVQATRSGWSEIWIADRNGANWRQLTHLKGAIAGFPRWSPDARRIAFHSRQQGYARLFLIDLLSGLATPLNYQPVHEALPSWSHDGKWLYCNSRRGGDFQVWRIRADGGQMTQLTSHGGWSPLESCDGRYVFYTKVSQSGVWRIPVAGGTEEQVFTDPVAAEATAYAVGRQGIYFVTGPNSDGQYSLALFSFITGKRAILEHFARPPDLGLAVSPDERTLMYSQIDHASSDLMLVENFQN